MKDRLQFRHHDAIFDTREEAIAYMLRDIRNSEVGLANTDRSQTFSLYAEPTVLRYKNVDDETNPHIILAVGAVSNQNEGAQYNDNRFCFIDIDNTEKEISTLDEKIQQAIESLTLFVSDTNTLRLSIERSDSGNTLSGDVKIPSTALVNDNNVAPNIIKATDNGIFTYVNMTYDKDTDKITFTVNGDTNEWDVNNDYLTGGTYSVEDESLHLNMLKGKEIVVSLEELINEWDVEGEDANSPIVLTRDKVLYEKDTVTGHRHVSKWQDTLKADVRISKDVNFNILEKTENNKALYVRGTADNINFFYNGENMKVSDVLKECIKKKLSTDNDNIIYERPDGIFATAKLEYDIKGNALIFTSSNQTGGTTTERFELNTIKIIENARYDKDTESLIFTYITAKGEVQQLSIPLSSLIEEWTVSNDGHSVRLSKERHPSNDKDVLTADVKVSSLDNNILVEKGDGLFVKGTADNVKYSDNSSVKDEISSTKETLDSEIKRAQNAEKEVSDAISDIRTTIGSGFTTDTHENITCKIEHLSDEVASKVTSVTAKDNTVVVDNTDTNNPKVGIKVSSFKRDGNIPNLISIQDDGIFAAVDLAYDEEHNALTFTTTNATKTINLTMNSIVDSIYYDNTKEAIIIEYTVNGKKMPNVEVPVRTLINEWTVSDNTDGAIKLTKKVNNKTALDNSQDILSAEIIIDKVHDDNMIVNDNGALYVSSRQINDVSSRLDAEIERSIAKDGEHTNLIDANKASIAQLDKDVKAEVARATAKDTELTSSVSAIEKKVTDIGTSSDKVKSDLASEIARATAKDAELTSSVSAIEKKVTDIGTSSDTVKSDLASEIARAKEKEGELEASLIAETTRAEKEETSIKTNLEKESTRAATAESALSNAITDETARAKAKEGELEASVNDAKLTFVDTTSVKVDATNKSAVKVSAKIAKSNNNLITLSNDDEQGLYASVSVQYDVAKDVLSLIGSDGTSVLSTTKLGAGSIVETITYDKDNKELVISYKTAGGREDTVSVSVEDLFNEWEVDSDENNVAIELRKAHNVGEKDVLTAKVQVLNDPTNMLSINNNKLYVSNEKVEKNATDIASTKTDVATVSGKVETLSGSVKTNLEELKALERASLGVVRPGEEVTYVPHTDAHFINTANSLHGADSLLDVAIFNVKTDVEGVKADVEGIKTDVEGIKTDVGVVKTDVEGVKTEVESVKADVKSVKTDVEGIKTTSEEKSKELKRLETVIGVVGNGDTPIVYPNRGNGILDGSTTYADADDKLESEVLKLRNLTSSTYTSTAKLYAEGADTEKKLKVDVKVSRGKGSSMEEGNLVITSVNDAEFSNTNVLRKVEIAGESIESNVNGLFLSNSWDCGEYTADDTPTAQNIFDTKYSNEKRQ